MRRKPAKEYAQERRDQEVNARVELRRAIPDELFTGNLADGDKTFSISAKIMMAATKCITSLKTAKPSRPKGTSIYVSPARDPCVAMLYQAMLRCAQTAEQRLRETDGVDANLMEVIERGYDILVDLNDMLQQGGMTEEQRSKWVQEQESWAKGFYLQNGTARQSSPVYRS
ncbi:hypothetical protein DV735_g4773, partial [Chaetothyriales sp. CBS 134920]